MDKSFCVFSLSARAWDRLKPIFNLLLLIFIISFLFVTLSQIVDIFHIEIQEFSKIKKMEIICAGYPKVDWLMHLF